MFYGPNKIRLKFIKYALPQQFINLFKFETCHTATKNFHVMYTLRNARIINSVKSIGAPAGIRTPNLLIRIHLLYQLAIGPTACHA